MYQYSFAQAAARDLTDIAVNKKLNVGVVGPYDGVYAIGEILQEEPKAQERDAEVPFLTDEGGQE